ncbi:MAG: DUF1028 domain-containing protein [Planctomycetota bacterium]|nr:DUF1028 domain-containing protein [Planctomycetota bacterium]
MKLEKSTSCRCRANPGPFLLLFVISFCLSGCCRCDQDSQLDDHMDRQIDRPRYGASIPSTSLGTGLAPEAGVSGTFSIVAVDPNTGVCGAAVASKYPAVGKVVPYARAGVGAFCTQHWHNPAWSERALDLLAEGHLPEQVLAELLRDDERCDKRQLAIIDMSGRAANRNPANADPSGIWWGAASGRYYACQGNTLAGQEVIFAMAKAYEQTQGSLADRLMAALITGDCAGGDHRGRLAAGIRVARKDVKDYWLELYVDKSNDAVVDLARKYAEMEHEAKGQWRGGKLPFKHPRGEG